MRSNRALIASYLFVSAVLAGNTSENNGPHFPHRLKRSTNGGTNTIYNNLFSGALFEMKNRTFSSVTGTFTVPTALGKDGTGTYLWVGMDGTTCPSSAVLVGIQLNVTNNETSYAALSWFGPSVPHTLDLEIYAGDVIKASINAPSPTSALVMIDNLTTGRSKVRNIDTASAPLCGENVGWIVEDFATSDNTTDIHFANFGSVTFSDAVACGAGIYTPDKADVAVIKIADRVLTSVLANASSVTITQL